MSKVEPDTGHTIEVIRPRLPRLLIDYYWVPVVVSLILFYYSKEGKPSWIELSFYPLYFLLGHLIKSLVQKQIVSAFVQLRQTGTLHKQVFQAWARGFQGRLNNHAGEFVFIAPASLIVLYHYKWLPGNLMSLRLDYLLSVVVVAVIDLLCAYLVGVAIWRAFATSWEFWWLGLRGELKIRPFHPDRCAGLKAIGNFCLSLSLVFVFGGLFLGGWILYANLFSAGALIGFGTTFALSLIVLTISILSFVFPIIGVHSWMKRQAATFEAQLDALGQYISDLEESVMSSSLQFGTEQLRAEYAKIESLRSIYSQRRKIPTWPFDLEIFGKFLTAQIAQIGLVLGLWEKVINLLHKIGVT